MDATAGRAREYGTSLAVGSCAAALGSRTGRMRRRGTGLGSLTGLLLCYPGEEQLPSPQVSTLILRRPTRNWGMETS